MGVNDAREQLEVAKADVARLEAEYEHLARLHEVATERTLLFAAVIEQAGIAPTVNATMALDALREVRAKAWDEGFNAALREVARRQGKSPVVPRRNPHREEATE